MSAGVLPPATLAALHAPILAILRQSDLTQVTAKKVRTSLEASGLLERHGIRVSDKAHKKAVDEQIKVCFDSLNDAPPPPPAAAQPAFGGIALPGQGGIPGSSAAAAAQPAAAPPKRTKSSAGRAKDEISSEEEVGGTPSTKKATKRAKKDAPAKKRRSKVAAEGGVKAERPVNPNNPFNKPMVLSAEMAALCRDKELPRYMVTKRLWEYIKANNLQNPENKRQIMCDAKLQSLFGKTSMDSFEIAKLLGPHLSKKPE